MTKVIDRLKVFLGGRDTRELPSKGGIKAIGGMIYFLARLLQALGEISTISTISTKEGDFKNYGGQLCHSRHGFFDFLGRGRPLVSFLKTQKALRKELLVLILSSGFGLPDGHLDLVIGSGLRRYFRYYAALK